MPFVDRVDAGKKLAEKLEKYHEEDTIVFALPRGGVVVGFEVASSFQSPLDVIVAKKIGMPDFPEFAIGAVAPGGVQILNQPIIRKMGVSDEILQQESERAKREMERQIKLFRKNGEMPSLLGKTAIIVDDGMATGLTALAAVESLGKLDPLRIVLALPVCSLEAADALASEVTELICLEKPYGFVAVGQFYENFEQVDDDEVINLLEKAKEMIRRKDGDERRD